MQHIDEGTIHAWLDGALPDDEAAAVAGHVAQCVVCSKHVAEARGLIASASRIVSALDHAPSGVIPQTEEQRDSGVTRIGGGGYARPWYRRPLPTAWRAAAAIVVVAGGTLLAVQEWRQRETPVRDRVQTVETRVQADAILLAEDSAIPAGGAMAATAPPSADQPPKAPVQKARPQDAPLQETPAQKARSQDVGSHDAHREKAPAHDIRVQESRGDIAVSTIVQPETASSAAPASNGAALRTRSASWLGASSPRPKEYGGRSPDTTAVTDTKFSKSVVVDIEGPPPASRPAAPAAAPAAAASTPTPAAGAPAGTPDVFVRTDQFTKRVDTVVRSFPRALDSQGPPRKDAGYVWGSRCLAFGMSGSVMEYVGAETNHEAIVLVQADSSWKQAISWGTAQRCLAAPRSDGSTRERLARRVFMQDTPAAAIQVQEWRDPATGKRYLLRGRLTPENIKHVEGVFQLTRKGYPGL